MHLKVNCFKVLCAQNINLIIKNSVEFSTIVKLIMIVSLIIFSGLKDTIVIMIITIHNLLRSPTF